MAYNGGKGGDEWKGKERMSLVVMSILWLSDSIVVVLRSRKYVTWLMNRFVGMKREHYHGFLGLSGSSGKQ